MILLLVPKFTESTVYPGTRPSICLRFVQRFLWYFLKCQAPPNVLAQSSKGYQKEAENRDRTQTVYLLSISFFFTNPGDHMCRIGWWIIPWKNKLSKIKNIYLRKLVANFLLIIQDSCVLRWLRKDIIDHPPVETESINVLWKIIYNTTHCQVGKN